MERLEFSNNFRKLDLELFALLDLVMEEHLFLRESITRISPIFMLLCLINLVLTKSLYTQSLAGDLLLITLQGNILIDVIAYYQSALYLETLTIQSFQVFTNGTFVLQQLASLVPKLPRLLIQRQSSKVCSK